jgi:hypothetical protein
MELWTSLFIITSLTKGLTFFHACCGAVRFGRKIVQVFYYIPFSVIFAWHLTDKKSQQVKSRNMS